MKRFLSILFGLVIVLASGSASAEQLVFNEGGVITGVSGWNDQPVTRRYCWQELSGGGYSPIGMVLGGIAGAYVGDRNDGRHRHHRDPFINGATVGAVVGMVVGGAVGPGSTPQYRQVCSAPEQFPAGYDVFYLSGNITRVIRMTWAPQRGQNINYQVIVNR